MNTSENPIRFAGDFPAASRDQWVLLVDKLLSPHRQPGDGSPEDALKKLRSTTYEGIMVEPLYTRDDVAGGGSTGFPGFSPFTRGRSAGDTGHDGWDVRALVHAGTTGARAVTELERGATSVLLEVAADEMLDASLLAEVLDGVFFDLAPVAVDAGAQWASVAAALIEAWTASKAAPEAVRGSLGADPLGVSVAVGPADVDFDLDAQLADLATWAVTLRRSFPNAQLITVDAARYHNAGGSDAQELGLMLAAGVSYLRILTTAGVAAADAFGLIELRIAATADQFATIAKVRAARRVWGRLAEACDVAEAAHASPLHAITSTAMMTRYDPWVNLLRTTVACFAAGVGGADSITVLPYDDLLDADGSELGHRLARNTQSVLALESNLAKVIDPAGGSWYVERRTEQLAVAAWREFQAIESAGGFRAASESGLIRTMVDETWDKRVHNLSSRHDQITGVSEFPNIAEPVPSDANADHPSSDSGLGIHRYAEVFESLRQRVDRRTAASGSRPTVFLAAIGTPAAYTARVTFAKNLFEIAGLTTLVGADAGDPTQIADNFTASGSTIACICSSDSVYDEHAVAVAAALAGAGAAGVLLAGRPKHLMQDLYDAGVGHFIYAGCNVRLILAELLDTLQVP